MRFIIIALLSSLLCSSSFAQVSKGPYLVNPTAQAWSKEISVHRAKEFVMKSVLDIKEGTSVKFDLEALHAATSGELTTLRLRCPEQNISGLILAFYGNYWNDAGVIHQGYTFKYFPEKEALNFLTTIDQNLVEHRAYLKSGDELIHNVSLVVDDVLILIYDNTHIRLLYGQFDSEWHENGLDKTQKHFLAD